MKISYLDNKIVLFMNSVENIDLKDSNNIRKYFEKIFVKLKNTLKIEVKGFYLIKIYKDINELVIEIKEEQLDYYNLYDEIDMKIIIEETEFLYEIDDIFIDKEVLKECIIIKYNNNIYLKVKNKIDKLKLDILKEIGRLKYLDNFNIINYGQYINIIN